MHHIRFATGLGACLLILIVGAGYTANPVYAQSTVPAAAQGFEADTTTPNGLRTLPAAAQHTDHGSSSGVLATAHSAGAWYCLLPRHPSPEEIKAFQECRQSLPECDLREWEKASDGSLVLICECGAQCVMSALGEEAEDE